MTDYDRDLIAYLRQYQDERVYEAAQRLEELINTLHQLKLKLLGV